MEATNLLEFHSEEDDIHETMYLWALESKLSSFTVRPARRGSESRIRGSIMRHSIDHVGFDPKLPVASEVESSGE